MNRTKRFLALLLALVMCLGMAACGGNETLEEKLFSEKVMAGVEHDGFHIRADSATEEQVAYASAYQSMISVGIQEEGFTYLRYVTLYYLTSKEDGQWYVPVGAYMPAQSTDDLYTNGYNSCNASFGNLQLGLQAVTFTLSASEMEELRTTYGWEDMNDAQLHLAYAADSYAASMNLNPETDEIVQRYNDYYALAALRTHVDGVERTIFIQTNLLDHGHNGEYVVAATVLAINDMEHMSEEENAVYKEILDYYNMNQWFN